MEAQQLQDLLEAENAISIYIRRLQEAAHFGKTVVVTKSPKDSPQLVTVDGAGFVHVVLIEKFHVIQQFTFEETTSVSDSLMGYMWRPLDIP